MSEGDKGVENFVPINMVFVDDITCRLVIFTKSYIYLQFCFQGKTRGDICHFVRSFGFEIITVEGKGGRFGITRVCPCCNAIHGGDVDLIL